VLPAASVVATDVHQHYWPEQLVSALSRRREPPRIRGRMLELAVEGSFEIDPSANDLDERLALLDRHAIDRAVISLSPGMETDPHPDLRDAYHEGIRDVVAASGGRLVALAAGECRPGFVGACVSASALAAGIDSLLNELDEAGHLLFVHPGPPLPPPRQVPPWWPAVVDYTAQMQAAYLAWLARDADRHPALPVVFAMLAGGAPIQLERLRSRGVEVRTALHSNVFFDASSYGRRALELVLATYGVTQLLFGSDVPVIDAGPTLAALHEFGETLAGVVLRENPLRVLRDAPSVGRDAD
jgi:hypothetical protein